MTLDEAVAAISEAKRKYRAERRDAEYREETEIRRIQSECPHEFTQCNPFQDMCRYCMSLRWRKDAE